MNIGIDIDGVLTDLENYILTEGYNFTLKNGLGFNKEMNKNSIYGFLKKEDSHQFWDKYWFEYAEKVSVRSNAAKVIKKLKEEGNKIIIIMARTYDSQIVKYGLEKQKKMEQLIITWLEKNQIFYDKIVFSNLNKLKDCLDNQIDIMIEDSVSNIEQLKNDMKVLCFDSKYNRLYKDKKVTRVYSWNDIYKLTTIY